MMNLTTIRNRYLAGIVLACAMALSLAFASAAFADEAQAEALEAGIEAVEAVEAELLEAEAEAVEVEVEGEGEQALADEEIVLSEEPAPEDPLAEDEPVEEEAEPEVQGKLVPAGASFRYVFADGTELANDWATVDGKTYYFDANGYAVRYTQVIDGKTYYFSGKCVMHRGLLTWGSDGRKSYFGEDGAAVTGWQTVAGKIYYFGEDLKTLRYGQTIDEKFYYFGSSGSALTGWLTWHADGRKSYFGEDGAAVTGWQEISGKTYYFDSAYKAVRYTQIIDDTRYYFNGGGVMHTGWLKWGGDGTYSYFDASGAMLFGEQVIDGVACDLGETGKIKNPPMMAEMNAKAQGYASATEYLILVDTTKNYVGVYTGSLGAWSLDRHFQCTTGAPATPTVQGSFAVGNRGLHFGENKGYTCWYWTQFYNDYLFHSVLYNPYSSTSIQDGRLGMNLSHGCVRLDIDNAKWIYDNIPRNTRVIVY